MDNRINHLTISTTSDRQTPQNDFGQMLARGIAGSASALTGAASVIAPGAGVVTAAITQTAAQAAGAKAMGSGGIGGGGTVTSGSSGTALPGATTAGGSGEGLEGQRQLMVDNQKWTEQYLALQNDMQRESREFNAVSNIMKVRHESAKTAINNIR